MPEQPTQEAKNHMLCFLILCEENLPIVIIKTDFTFFFRVASKNSATARKRKIDIDGMHLLTF